MSKILKQILTNRQKYLYLILGLSLCFARTTEPVFSKKIEIITNSNNQHRYLLTPQMSWQEAQNFAREMGGNLVTINDRTENQWLVENFTDDTTQFLWIGINDRAKEGYFCWVSGQSSSYTNWADKEPNNNLQQGGEDWGVLNGKGNPFKRPVGTWSDAPDRVKLRGIVEIIDN